MLIVWKPRRRKKHRQKKPMRKKKIKEKYIICKQNYNFNGSPLAWTKNLSSLSKGHEKLSSLLSEIVESPNTAPKWLSEGTIHLPPKTKDTKNPKNYRPITCLITTYKLLTSILAERTYTFMEDTMHLHWSKMCVNKNFISVKTSCS